MSYQLKQKVKGEQGDEYIQVGADLGNKNVILHVPTSTDTSGKIHSFDVKFKETHKFEFYEDSAYNINVLRDTVTGEIYPIPNIELNQLVEFKNEKFSFTKIFTKMQGFLR